MGLEYRSLDQQTRQIMLEEFNLDISSGNMYLSKRFNDFGEEYYVKAMPKHIMEGSDDTLAEDLKNNDCFKSHEERKNPKGGVTLAKIPETACQTFAEGEFNRFYIRALSIRAATEGRPLQIYRGRQSTNPRPESEALIGSNVNPGAILNDLRENKGIDTVLGLPSGPNSGLTVNLI